MQFPSSLQFQLIVHWDAISLEYGMLRNGITSGFYLDVKKAREDENNLQLGTIYSAALKAGLPCQCPPNTATFCYSVKSWRHGRMN